MVRLVYVGILAAAFLLNGCQTLGQKPSAAELAQHEADFGEMPADYENQIKTHFESSLKDPYSAVYKFGRPYQGKVWTGIVNGGDKYGWVVDFTLNAKNSFGGYTGVRAYSALFQRGALSLVSANNPYQ